MTQMTKVTIIEWEVRAREGQDTTFVESVAAKVEELLASGKTDGEIIIDHNNPFTVQRRWIDAAAAQEWVDYMSGMANGIGFPLKSVKVEDLSK
jgi:hypothetical protein